MSTRIFTKKMTSMNTRKFTKKITSMNTILITILTVTSNPQKKKPINDRSEKNDKTTVFIADHSGLGGSGSAGIYTHRWNYINTVNVVHCQIYELRSVAVRALW